MATSSSSDFEIFKRLLNRSRDYWPHFGGILLLDLLATPLTLLSPLALKLVVDNVLGNEPIPRFLVNVLPSSVEESSSGMLIFAVILMIAVSVLSQIQSLISSFFTTYTGAKIGLDFRAHLFWHGQRLSMAYHDAKGVSHTLYRVRYDANAVRYVAMDGLIPMITSVVTIVAMIYIIAKMSTQLAFVALLICPVLVYLIKLYRGPLRKGWRRQKRLDNAAMSVITEVFSSLRIVKAFTQEEREQERYTDRATESLSARLRVNIVQGSFSLATGTVTAVGTGAVLFIGVRTIQAGAMTLGDLLVVMTYLGMLYGPLKTIGSQLASMQNSFASAERVFDFLDEPSDVLEKSDALPLLRVKGAIKLADVSFGYEADVPVLCNVSMDIPPGARVGIAGVTGAGKTTLMSLLMRFYDPSSGAILLDGEDIRNYRLADLRGQYGIVLQEPVLFSTSIADNIAYGRPGASQEDIVNAAMAANADDFIQSLTDGYETMVGERGMRLSGGERQRIALARAFLRDAPILLLDEPTSSVDMKTEEGIMEAMERLMKGRTTFMIAHRLTTLENCDLLFEVKDRKVTQILSDSIPGFLGAGSKLGTA